MNRFIFSVCASLMICASAFADVTEKVDGLEINYSQMKVRFVGKSTWVKEDGPVFRAAEQRAWSEGITGVTKQLPKILADRSATTENEAWQAVSFQGKDTISVKTVYAGDDSVTVLLENFFDASAGKNNKSGSGEKSLVVALSSKVTPRFNYEISDESGSMLLKSDAQKLFKSRWFKKNDQAALANFVSADKVQVDGRFGGGKITLAQADWNEAVSKLGGTPDRVIFLVP